MERALSTSSGSIPQALLGKLPGELGDKLGFEGLRVSSTARRASTS